MSKSRMITAFIGLLYEQRLNTCAFQLYVLGAHGIYAVL